VHSHEADVAEAIIEAVIRTLWAYRTEVAILSLLGIGWLSTERIHGPRSAWAALATAVLLVVVVAPIRRRMARRLRHARAGRQWSRAVRAARIKPLEGRTPSARGMKDIPAGEQFYVKVPPGSSVAHLDKKAEVLAAALRAREVRIRRDPANASRAEVVIARRDPLSIDSVIGWPYLDAPQVSLWSPIPVGVGEEGQLVTLSLPERNVLVGGEPGSGKSAALSLLVASAALDPTSELWLLDGKLVELAVWRRCANGSVGVSVAGAIDLLLHLQSEMEERYAMLLEAGKRKVSPGDGLPLHVVVCDELAHYLTATERKDRLAFAEVLRDLISRGRAAGIIVLAATQKPSSDVIPTSVRDLFGFRWALRCSTPQASDTILGSGWASAGYSAARIDPALRGVGYLLHEGGIPVRLRSCLLDDDAVAHLATRAEVLRAGGV